ncbi:MAG: hypothetical protein LLF76_08810 [Planctomycetaceae bacterium]|nr:hypothetical protein [Planctomycetaceae bacterium]
MTKREIASLTIKLMGVWMLIKALSYLPMSITQIVSLREIATRGILFAACWTVGLAALAVIWAAVIILFSNRFAKWLIKDNQTVELNGPINKRDVLTVAFACIGLFLIVTAMPTLLNSATLYFLLRRIEEGYGEQSANQRWIAATFSELIQIGLGVWLFAGSQGIARFWENIRGFGLKKV